MNEEMVTQMMAAAERLAAATEALDRVLGKFDAQQEALNAKVDRIVAAVEENLAQVAERGSAADAGESAIDLHSGQARTTQAWEAADLRARVTELEKVECRPEGSGVTAGKEDDFSGGGGADGQERDRGRTVGPGSA